MANGSDEHIQRWPRAPAFGRIAGDVGSVVTVADVRRLPVPVTAIWDWQMRAACRDLDSAVFFHPDRERGPDKHRRDARAKRICAGCPVIEQCRRHALAVREPYGVWGGMTVTERNVVLGAQSAAAAGHQAG